jgi:hypothetical protein
VAISSAVVVRLPDRWWLSGTAGDSGMSVCGRLCSVLCDIGAGRDGWTNGRQNSRSCARRLTRSAQRSGRADAAADGSAEMGRTDDPEALAHVVVEGQSDPYIL